MKLKETFSVKSLVFIAMMSAISFILTIFPKFNIFPSAPWLDIDISEMPAALSAAFISPVAGAAVVIIKSVLHLFVSSTSFVGLIANWLIGLAFILPFGIFYKLLSSKMNNRYIFSAISFAAAVPFQVAAAVFSNLYILLPLFHIDLNAMFGNAWGYLIFLIPHNILKDILTAAITILIIPALKKPLAYIFKS